MPATAQKSPLPTRLAQLILSGCALLLLPPHSSHAADNGTVSQPASAAAVLQAMQRVADWQLAQSPARPPRHWAEAVGSHGLMALAQISGDGKYAAALQTMARQQQWQLGERPYHADDHAIGQTYVDLYLQSHSPQIIAPLQARFDAILARRASGTLDFQREGNQDRWSWCDALYMGAPTWVRLWAATGDQRYLDFALSEWWTTSDFLYDRKQHLFVRDSNYFGQRSSNGQPVFWSRGNGWVMAALVRVLQFLPEQHPQRARLLEQYHAMAVRVLSLQQADGLWRASLLDPQAYPLAETSGSALFTYALGWGVNQGLLPEQPYRSAVRRAWQGLQQYVQADGKLTHVQPIGRAPQEHSAEQSEVYGVGAYLLAGSELYRMAVLDGAAAREISIRNPQAQLRTDELAAVALPAGSPPMAVMDGSSAAILPSQVQDGELLFPVHLAAQETRRYRLVPAAQLAAVPPVERKTHARFVPERLDDFAWESDRTAHRVYGPAIMQDPVEHLISSGVDVWGKKVRTPVIDNWYRRGDYHHDFGEGLDFYSVGQSRGCGGSTIYYGGTLHSSANFARYKVLADGPLRAIFEFSYDSWDSGRGPVSETKRYSIDAGSNLTRVESRLQSASAQTVGIGMVQRAAADRYRNDSAAGWASLWQAPHPQHGSIACGVILPAGVQEFRQVDSQWLSLSEVQPGQMLVYYFGAGWSGSGDFADASAWETYLARYAEKLRKPLEIRSKP